MQDTLVIDSAQIAQWQAQPDFDYNREIVGGGMTVTEWLMMQLNELMEELFGQALRNPLVQWLLAILAAGVIGFIVWYLWSHQSGLFRRQEQLAGDENTEDNIYGVDFDAAITEALGRENYREAVRLVYLRTLKALSDTSRIDWQPFKTPSQYVREFSASVPATSPAGPSAAFRTLTAHFLRVRYGNFPATRPLYDEVEKLGKEVARES